MTSSTSLDLGCGQRPKNPFDCNIIYGVDIAPGHTSEFMRAADLCVEPIPLEDASVDAVTAYDFLEHVPRVLYIPKRINPFINLLNEISRVLKPGGLFFHSTPCYPHPAAFQDPTHVNIITIKTFVNYFSVAPGHRCLARMYGYNGNLSLLSQSIYSDSHLRCLMQKKIEPGDSNLSTFAKDDCVFKFSYLMK